MWIKEVKAGNKEAARHLWDRYFDRLVIQARRELARRPRTPEDPEDIALDAFLHLYHRAATQALPELMNRENLWEMLLGIIAWKARDAVRKEYREKRGGGRVLSESCLNGPEEASSAVRGIEQVADRPRPPHDDPLRAEEVEALLELLGPHGSSLRSVAEWKMEGRTNEEIATELVCSSKTVERKLRDIRKIWISEVTDERSARGAE